MKALRTFRVSTDVTVEDDQPDDYTHEDAVIRAAEDAARRLMCDGADVWVDELLDLYEEVRE